MNCNPPDSSVHGISRQEHWRGLPFPSPGDLPDPGIKLESPALAGRFFTTLPPGKPPKRNVLGGDKKKNQATESMENDGVGGCALARLDRENSAGK